MKIIRLLQLSDVHWTKQLDSADDYTDIRDQMLQDLEYYCKCKKCKYIDPTEKEGYKWYCEYYERYEDPDEVKECKYYTDR